MHLKKIEISQIRSIEHFEMTFKEPAGWHVLIGDNGAGKSTIVRSAALALLLEHNDVIIATRGNWNDWLNQKAKQGRIFLEILTDERFEKSRSGHRLTNNSITFSGSQNFEKAKQEVNLESIVFDNQQVFKRTIGDIKPPASPALSGYTTTTTIPPNLRKGPWFSAAYGPYRRFTGGNIEREKLYISNPRLGAHLSVFGEDVALSEALTFLRELYVKKLENQKEGDAVDNLIKFINEAQLLPHNTQIDNITYDDIYFKDGNGSIITAIQMSDGFRSMLSLTFELIRQLIRAYGQDKVFQGIRAGKMVIDLPGVVLIDEIDAHLHPTWQTRIGFWFLKYFPSLQFIVTTHSPLICRACEKGSIWRLAAPGSKAPSGEVTGTDRDRLIFGNVLDAYSTEVFGRDVERSDQSKVKLERLAKLGMLNSFGKISEAEKKELDSLRKILATDDPTEF